MKICGSFLFLEDGVTFVWFRAFHATKSRNALRESFYRGTLWVNDLGVLLMPLLAHYETVLFEDTANQWESWSLRVRSHQFGA
jgi:hypothetical protein